MKLKGVIFDFNGTLFWDTEIHNRAWDTFLLNRNICLSDNEKNRKIHGRNNRDILNDIFQTNLPENKIRELSREKEKIYRDLCMDSDMQLAPGAEQLFAFLTDRKIPFTIATASEADNVDFYFRMFRLDTYFDRLKIIHDDGKMPGKPDPLVFLKAMDTLELKGGETLIFEDSISGITAAEKAGAGKIIIVDSCSNDYSRWDYQTIKDFSEVDRSIF